MTRTIAARTFAVDKWAGLDWLNVHVRATYGRALSLPSAAIASASGDRVGFGNGRIVAAIRPPTFLVVWIVSVQGALGALLSETSQLGCRRRAQWKPLFQVVGQEPQGVSESVRLCIVRLWATPLH
jgi:hypothetical protein